MLNARGHIERALLLPAVLLMFLACGLSGVALKSKGFVNQLTILAVIASSQLTKWNFQNILNILEQFTTKHDDR